MSEWEKRAVQFGPTGDYLLTVLKRHPEVGSFAGLSFVDSLTRLRALADRLHTKDILLPAAVSLIVLPFPLQVTTSRADVYALLTRGAQVPFDFICSGVGCDLAIKRLGWGENGRKKGRAFLQKVINDAAFREKAFPHKRHSASTVKPNLVLAPLARSLSACAGPTLAGLFLMTLAFNVANDAAIGAIVYAYGLVPHFGRKAYDIAAWLVLRPDHAKGLSTALKALGANAHPFGAVLCEANVLQGRAVGELDLNDEAQYRCSAERVAEQVLEPGDRLEEHIRAVIAHEVRGRKIELPELGAWWEGRWGWCVNGSQNDNSSRLLGIDTQRFSEFHTRAYRRMAAEAVEREPVSTWDGVTLISASPKLEAGKTRAIFACDTRSYFAFEWLLGAVQKVWRNDRVLLDPGKGGHLGVARRVRNFMTHGGVNLMLDYDDFNSHHSLKSQKCIFRVLNEMAGAPQWYRDVIDKSWDSMYVTLGGRNRRWLGTLPSGHRGTTIVNSILNAAYIRMAVGGPLYDRLLSLHTGDDVYMRVDTLDGCRHILDSTRALGCRLNPAKQSVGFATAEFLRMTITARESRGYLARAVSAFIAGNWVNENPLDPADMLRTAITSTRSLINRSGQHSYGRLIAPALRMRQPIATRTLVDLLSGAVALDASPVFNTDGRIRTYATAGNVQEQLPLSTRWPSHATKAYLCSHVSPVEASAIERSGVDVGAAMLASSFSKGHSSLADVQRRVYSIRRGETYRARGLANAAELVQREPEKGVLTKYPLIQLVRSRLSDDDIRELLSEVGVSLAGRDPQLVAFGDDMRSKNIIGSLSHSDAGSLSKLTKCGNIYTLTPVYV
ncbi:RNA-dependent RNA polymerase [Neofusicoccum parvum victorivirus 3]|uniref:RNA-directed RNA polymerase n=1 Tax=Neofusicoccum parvum victorivirus 3 TaxID=2880267 RepID=A0AAE9C020_9VIRU|nr:RNA-dependent RNA polymerase [Neofusicoccum parvum victorivirus 3]